jgi:thaumatin family protein
MAFSRTRKLATSIAAAVPAAALVVACSSPGGAALAGQPGQSAEPVAASHAPASPGAITAMQSSPARSTRLSPSTAAPRTSVPPPVPAAVAVASGKRLVTFVNKVSQTIWVAAAQNSGHPMTTAGWVLPAGQSLTIAVPDKWNGRFWGRTGCVFHHGLGHCQTGDCNGRFQCTGNGAIPATLAEYDLNAWDGLDFYDVSMVDGSNLPMYINITAGQTRDKISRTGCVPTGCTRPVACPSALQVKAGGVAVACESACARFGTDQYCCRGAWAPRSQCNPAKWPVDYAAVFKKAEPYAYSYVDDDATSVFTCKGRCDYRITFGVTPASEGA